MSLWNKHKFFKTHISPQAHMKNIKTQYKETSLSICHTASLTMEAAVILPLLTGVVVSILFLFRVIQIQAVVEEALFYAGRKVAVEASVMEDEFGLFASATGFLQYALKDEPVVEQYVDYGSLGITLLGSSFEGEAIVLRAHYRIALPISFFGIDSISCWNKNRFRKWQGDAPTKEEEGEFVYITEHGEVYHSTSGCQAIRLLLRSASVYEIDSLRGENGQKYYECSRCAEENFATERVYYTSYGTLYHRQMNCSYIKRTIIKISRLQLNGQRPCSYCYERKEYE